MAEFQTVLGIVMIVVAVVLVALMLYNLIIIGKATTTASDSNATLSNGEKKGALASNVVAIVAAIVIGIYGVVILLPTEKATNGVAALRGSRSLSGSVLSRTGEYM